MQHRHWLKNTGIYIEDHFCAETMRKRGSLIPILKEMKKLDPRTQLRGDKITYKGRLYNNANLHELPIDAHNATTKTKDEVTLFSGRFSRLSNLNPVCLEIDNREWQSVEHYYQFQKAIHAGNEEVARTIIVTQDPVEVMYLGKTVKAQQDWNETFGKDIMRKAMEVKFSIPAYRLALKKTAKFIGEATRSAFWGVGKPMNDPDAYNRRTWSGKNITGEILMSIKQIIK